MYRYVNDVSSIAQFIIKSYCAENGTAVDATLGNGHDSDFLSSMFEKVYSFDIQKQCIDNYSKKNVSNVLLINDSHKNIDKYVTEKIQCAMFNLGFLPGGDKTVTTQSESTLIGLKHSLNLLESNGIVTIAIYTGHKGGREERDEILKFAEELPKSQFGVLLHSFLNRSNFPPELLVIERK